MRSPISSCRWPRPMGIIVSISRMPVLSWRLTGERSMIPAASRNSGGAASDAGAGSPSNGWPSASTTRPSIPVPTGRRSGCCRTSTVCPTDTAVSSPRASASTSVSVNPTMNPRPPPPKSRTCPRTQDGRPESFTMPRATSVTTPVSRISALMSQPPAHAVRQTVIHGDRANLHAAAGHQSRAHDDIEWCLAVALAHPLGQAPGLLIAQRQTRPDMHRRNRLIRPGRIEGAQRLQHLAHQLSVQGVEGVRRQQLAQRLTGLADGLAVQLLRGLHLQLSPPLLRFEQELPRAMFGFLDARGANVHGLLLGVRPQAICLVLRMPQLSLVRLLHAPQLLLETRSEERRVGK